MLANANGTKRNQVCWRIKLSEHIVQFRIRAARCFWVFEIILQCYEYGFRKHFYRQDGLGYFFEIVFPFSAMRSYAPSMLLKGHQMGYFM